MKMCVTAKKIRTKQMFGLVLGVVLLGSLFGILLGRKVNTQSFQKPSFEKKAIPVEQVDTTDESYSMLQVAKDYQVGLCGQPVQEGNSLIISFVNPKENKAWLQLFIYDEKHNLLGSSGVIKQGEGLQSISLKQKLEPSEILHVQVAGYEPETYYSMGEMNFQTCVRG